MTEIFIGIEAEGRLRGVQTVFVAGPPSTAEQLIASSKGITHIFYGARGYVLTSDDYERIAALAIPSEWCVTVHVPLDRAASIPAFILSRCHVLLYAKAPSAVLAADTEIKLEDSARAAIYGSPMMINLEYVYDRTITKD